MLRGVAKKKKEVQDIFHYIYLVHVMRVPTSLCGFCSNCPQLSWCILLVFACQIHFSLSFLSYVEYWDIIAPGFLLCEVSTLNQYYNQLLFFFFY